MPINPMRGDLLRSSADALVNAVNCRGVMGRGLALQFRRAYPDNYTAYRVACRSGDVRPGRMFVYERRPVNGPRFIVNFPTKDHWGDPSRMSYITDGLIALVGEIERLGIRSIALPAIGCGLGGLPWDEVRPEIEVALRDIPGTRVDLYLPPEVAWSPSSDAAECCE